MDIRLYYTELYDLYGSLLTEKQKKYFEDYYFDNLSLAEMAENYEVSRNAIHKQLKETVDKLIHLETNLKIKQKKEFLLKLTEQIKEKELKQEFLKIIE